MRAMENFDDFENKSYQAAPQPQYTASQQITFAVTMIKAWAQVTLLLIVEIFTGIFKLFTPKKPKDIKGQLALVTGALK